jgi:hypothetical protein
MCELKWHNNPFTILTFNLATLLFLWCIRHNPHKNMSRNNIIPCLTWQIKADPFCGPQSLTSLKYQRQITACPWPQFLCGVQEAAMSFQIWYSSQIYRTISRFWIQLTLKYSAWITSWILLPNSMKRNHLKGLIVRYLVQWLKHFKHPENSQ